MARLLCLCTHVLKWHSDREMDRNGITPRWRSLADRAERMGARCRAWAKCQPETRDIERELDKDGIARGKENEGQGE